ncbi:PREDICTED: cilia- and flagella-associated protein 20 [Chlamydotis macqueenii]|uniref:cilia- and flagella-associated protein 20 n=1 Tax=Chlamydotis macqueenii TaxID=187382 RepID=UPI000529A595|nr:PREDICTED: cilia- and flagella-associated protein 20 [Chlamydotis macqueenii]
MVSVLRCGDTLTKGLTLTKSPRDSLTHFSKANGNGSMKVVKPIDPLANFSIFLLLDVNSSFLMNAARIQSLRALWWRPLLQPSLTANVCSVIQVRNGHIKRITDNDIQSLVLEIEGTNVSTTYITCPADPKKTLGIKLPFLVMIIKNLKKYFTFEVQVLDDKNVRRRFRASNYQSTTRVKPFICTMPMRLDDGWNQIQFNLSDFTRRAYGTNYIETLRVQIHANCRIRRVYFSDRLYSEDELPAEFKLYLPVQNKAKQ